MEALNGVQVGLLTIYDMCKAVDRGMVISGVVLIEKRGGEVGHVGRWRPMTRKGARKRCLNPIHGDNFNSDDHADPAYELTHSVARRFNLTKNVTS